MKPATRQDRFSAAIEQAATLQQQGKLDEAEDCLRPVLAAQPHHPMARMYRALITLKRGEYEKVVEQLGPLLDVSATLPQIYHILGTAQLSLQCYAEAELTYRRLLQVTPDSAIGCNQLGAAQLALNRLAEAEASFRKAISLQPDNIEAIYNLANALRDQERYVDAISVYQQALVLNPGYGDAYNNLGVCCLELGLTEEAKGCFIQAAQLQPHSALPHNNLGNLYKKAGVYTQAIAHYQRALALDPGFLKPLVNLATLYLDQANYPDAIACCEQAIRINPQHADAYNNLSAVYFAMGDYAQAMTCCQQAMALKPDYAEAIYSCGVAQRGLGDIPGAIASYHRALVSKPDYALALNMLIFQMLEICQWEGLDALERQVLTLLHGPSAPHIQPFTLLAMPSTPAEQRLGAEYAYQRSIAPATQQVSENAVAVAGRGHERLRIGYLSADYHSHATSYLIAELFELHDRRRFEVFAYSYGPDDSGPMRKRLVAACDRFVDIAGDANLAAARRIHQDGVDILVDLKGYTQGSRSAILGFRPAPLQLNWLGYPGTMGGEAVDYILADRHIIPPQYERFYSEKVIRLPDCYQINDRQRQVDERQYSRQDCGLPETGVVFCSFNQNYKITPEMFDVWMRILTQLPDSCLWLLAFNPWAADNLRREAAQRGIDPDRLVFAEKLPLAEHLARYRLADICLDTYPVNSHTTASDALWVGCPLVTCAGETFASRVASSLLHNVGLSSLVTDSLSAYEAKVLALARHPEYLAQLRQKLLAERMTSPLFDSPRFVANLELAYETIWQDYQRQVGH